MSTTINRNYKFTQNKKHKTKHSTEIEADIAHEVADTLGEKSVKNSFGDNDCKAKSAETCRYKPQTKQEKIEYRKKQETHATEELKKVLDGKDSKKFMDNWMFGHIEFDQGNENYGYKHILKRIEDEKRDIQHSSQNILDQGTSHEIMLKDNNIAKVLAHGKYYEDDKNIIVLDKNTNSSKAVILVRKDNCLTVITAYVLTKRKADLFRKKTALYNSER